MSIFEGTNALVVGGGGGLGRQYSLDLGRYGARVMIVGRSDTVHEVAKEVCSAGGTASALVADARDGDAIMSEMIARYGSLDAMVVNAGIVRDRTFAKMSFDEWREVVSIHLDGAFACCHAAWPHLIAQRGGQIVLTTSGAGLHGNFGQANYAAAKGAIIALTRSLAVEGAAKNVRVNAIAPMALTPMTADVFDEQAAGALPAHAVSPFVLALLHPSCSENGSIIEAGGGWAAALRWERSRGCRFDPTTDMLPSVMAGWQDIMDFSTGSDRPSTTRDSMQAGIGEG